MLVSGGRASFQQSHDGVGAANELLPLIFD